MNRFSRLLHCDGSTDRLTYQRNVALLAFAKSTIDLLTLSFAPGTDPGTVALAWVDPFVLVWPWLAGNMPWPVCLGTLLFFAALVWNSVHRARNAGWMHWTGLLAAVPFVNVAMTVLLALTPARKRAVWDLV